MKAESKITLPSSKEVRERMQSCRNELDALKRLLRAAEAEEKAEQARAVRLNLDKQTNRKE